jgi:nucleoside-diphosphate-sugar epimerase
MAETLCMTFFRKHNIPVKILRILLAYGPGIKNDGKVISDFFYKLKKDGEITLRDRGDAKRSFCYISDTIRAILKIMFEGQNGEAYNIGNDLETENLSIYELAELIIKISEKNTLVKPNFEAPSKEIYGINNRLLNINKLRSLGFSPKISLEEGLLRLKRYYIEIGVL